MVIIIILAYDEIKKKIFYLLKMVTMPKYFR